MCVRVCVHMRIRLYKDITENSNHFNKTYQTDIMITRQYLSHLSDALFTFYNMYILSFAAR
jgi:hypothetical protein